MTDEVSELVLEDNRLQSLALSIAEARGAKGLPGLRPDDRNARSDAAGSTARSKGSRASDVLLRRGVDGRGLTRPELAVVLSMSKLTLQAAAEELKLADDPTMDAELMAAFPEPMQKKHADAIRAHRLRHQIVATKVANRLVNRLGPSVALDMTEEEGVGLPQVIAAFLVAERLLDLANLWDAIEQRQGRRSDAHRTVRGRRAQRPRASRRRDPRRRRRDQRRARSRTARARPRQGRGQGRRADPRRSARRIRRAPRAARSAWRRARRSSTRWSACTNSTACSASPRWARARASTSWP